MDGKIVDRTKRMASRHIQFSHTMSVSVLFIFYYIITVDGGDGL